MSYLGIDTDNSNSIDFAEILKMFNDNNIDVKPNLFYNNKNRLKWIKLGKYLDNLMLIML